MRHANGWSGGQYSVYRSVFGAYLLLILLSGASGMPLALRGLGAASAVAFGLGFRDRAFSLVLWGSWAYGAARDPLALSPGPVFVGLLLFAHALLPRAPYGSWDARGRPDPAGGWHLPQPIFAAAWAAMALGYAYSAATKLLGSCGPDGTALAAATWTVLGLELLFAPLALIPRLRPWLWLGMLSVQLGRFLPLESGAPSFGMVLLHGFTFDPSWVRARLPSDAALRVYYDGACGLCHATVRFLLAEDRTGVIRYAPLSGTTFARERDLPAALPDAVIVRTSDALLVRSAAVLALGRACGGLWRVIAVGVGLVPRPILDALYDRVAAVRHRLFRRPENVCPIVPPRLRARFLD